MKKTAICLMAALGMTAVSLTSCDSSCKPVKELANASDSLVYAVGVLTGTDVNSGIQNLGQPVDIDQFIKGAKKALYSDSTAFSYELGEDVQWNESQKGYVFAAYEQNGNLVAACKFENAVIIVSGNISEETIAKIYDGMEWKV